MTKTTGSFLQRADYSEDNVAIVIERFLTVMCFPGERFSIEVFSQPSERHLGADARLNSAIQGFRPFYMQFKRPMAYPGHSTSRIITDRAKLGVGSNPHALFFELRDKRPKQKDYQHNVLYRLRQQLLADKSGEAAYVCPLFLDHAAYRTAAHRAGFLHWLSFWRREPWLYRDLVLDISGGSIAFDHIPILAEHVTIPPHDLVTTARHHYSFNEGGRELCFHEPTTLGEEASLSLAKFLAREVESFRGDSGKLSPEDSIPLLNRVIAEVYGEREPAYDREGGPIGLWNAFGARLRRDFNIVQFALVRWDKPYF